MNATIGDIATIRQGPSRSGRSAGARQGDREVMLVNGNHIQGDTLQGPFESILFPVNERTDKHILLRNDVLVTGKSTAAKVALVPAGLVPAVANSTLLVVRAPDPGLGLYVWWWLTSRQGRAAIESRMVASATLSFLPPRALAEVQLPLPSSTAELRNVIDLVEASERSYRAATWAATLRRDGLRDAYFQGLTTSGQVMGRAR